MTFIKFNSRFSKKTSLFSAMTGLSLLAGCYTPVQDLKPTTFGQDQLNRASEGRLVTILALMPARATVVNTNNREAVGTGGWIGDWIEPPQLHPQSMVISYQDPNNPQIQSAVEIAKPCEFKTGTAYAVLIDGQTKIQPNNFDACLKIAKEKKHKGDKKTATADQNMPASQPSVQPQPVAPASQPVQTPSGSQWQNNVAKPLTPAQQALQLQSQQNWPVPQTYAK